MPLQILEAKLAAQLKALPKDSQRQFLSLYNKSPGKLPFSTIFKTNALPCGSDSPVGAVYPTICLINHSCVPNSHNNWNDNLEHETIHAIRPIEAGEEITIPYDKGGCTCLGCSLPPPELDDSDARRLQIQLLDAAIGDPYRIMSEPREVLRDCYSMLQNLNEEFGGYIGILGARLYYDAFQISIAHGDQARASVFAKRAYESRVLCEGEDSPEAQRVRSLAMKPARHMSFELASRQWRRSKDMVPKSLDTESFEKWLFKLDLPRDLR
ncbi:hypothetical protein BU24DRAFT_437867 [Aaosphaeria arxii CBS 175.79]|uniref:SET domain-containing protein n=1 Tax=Aaosphaeria arxii CBS 175.79 TaxID=1450172 RepID=A0A6A5X649_9PLEO|nr:uncharacterized protein BU24DRAFT_437867 [Aaosphaeria arxii CBS 175.79]KAF2008485.1 hypothetical protein BU24DRAFT_437867 [Aaosphaeria arxii CBS 175.79]